MEQNVITGRFAALSDRRMRLRQIRLGLDFSDLDQCDPVPSSDGDFLARIGGEREYG
jgi:hypothetical protein